MAKDRKRSLDDLLGGDDSNSEAPLTKAIDSKTDDWAQVRRGVTQAWLTGALRMDKRTVKKRLAECPIAEKKAGNIALYDLAQAMSFLVKPRFDIEDYMRNMNPEELPPRLKSEYWKAKRSEQEYKERAGELWHTEDVIMVLGDTAKTIRGVMQTWIDALERKTEVTPEQYRELQSMVDDLRNEIARALVEMPALGQTPNLLGEEDDDD